MNLITSQEAEQDLLDIWLYIAEDSELAADQWIDELVNKANWLTDFAEAGVTRPELAKGLCSFPVGRYVLFYRYDNETLELVRVLHSSRDINAQF